jgi:hypothetical protein
MFVVQIVCMVRIVGGLFVLDQPNFGYFVHDAKSASTQNLSKCEFYDKSQTKDVRCFPQPRRSNRTHGCSPDERNFGIRFSASTSNIIVSNVFSFTTLSAVSINDFRVYFPSTRVCCDMVGYRKVVWAAAQQLGYSVRFSVPPDN